MPTFGTQVADNQVMLVVAVSVPSPGDDAPKHTFRALVDTGAQSTLVTARVVRQLDAASVGMGAFMSANGQTELTDVFRLHISIPIAEAFPAPDGGETVATFARGRDLQTMLMPFDPPGYDVLLGMDILSHFHITMCQGLFVLSN